MRYLVTGGAGFIGSNLVEKLLEEGHTVRVVDNLSTGKKEFIEPFLDRIEFIHGDLRDPNVATETTAGVDAVFHLAANADVKGGAEDTRVDLENGILATYNILEGMRKNDVEQIVFSSSSVVYGEAKEIPTPEDYGPLKPISLYGGAKLAAEGLVSAFSHSFGFRAWIYRFANIVGKNGTHGVIYDFILKLRKDPGRLLILGNGKQSKSYLLVEDCVAGMLHGYRHPTSERVEVYNLGNHGKTNVIKIADIVTEVLGLKNVKYEFTGTERGWVGDVVKMELSIEKILSTGWKPSTDSDGAVKKAASILAKQMGAM